jgi:hypothetical protein
MTLKTCPVGGETSKGSERALPPDDPAVTVKDFMYRPPGIEVDPIRLAHRRGSVVGAGRIFERYRLVDRFLTKWSEHLMSLFYALSLQLSSPR